MILITTSHRPSPRVRSFIKDLVSILPGATKMNRGHKTLAELAIEAFARGLNYVAIVSERGGNPSTISIYEITAESIFRPQLLKTADLVIQGVRLSRENPQSSRAYSIKCLYVDSSKCVSDDCYYLADLVIKIFNRALCNNPDVVVKLEEEKYILVKFANAHGNTIGPLIRLVRILRRR